MKILKKQYIQIIVAMTLGFVLSITFDSSTIFIPLGDIFIRLLKMMIVPIVFMSITVGIGTISNSTNLSRLGLKTILYYLCTSLLSISIGLLLTNIIKPGQYFSLDNLPPDINPQGELTAPSSFIDMIYRIIPTNPLSSMVNGDMLSIIFFAIIFGFSITKIDGNYKKAIQPIIISLYEIVMYITRYIIKLAPIGVFGLIIKAVHHSGTGIIPSIGVYMLTILIGLLIHLLIILPTIFYLFTSLSPLVHFRAMRNAMMMAFSTSSSSATLPVTMSCVRDKVKVSKTTSGFVLPLGATVNMDGTALYECAGVLFIAQILPGIELTILQQATVVFTALLASIGAAGIPSAGLVMIFIVLQSVGISNFPGVDIIVGAMLAVDRPLDMLRTMVNVTSDSIGAAIIAKSEGENLY